MNPKDLIGQTITKVEPDGAKGVRVYTDRGCLELEAWADWSDAGLEVRFMGNEGEHASGYQLIRWSGEEEK